MFAFTRQLFAAIALLIPALAIAQNGPPPTLPAPADVSSTASITEPFEPGERLVVDGQVFAPDGVTSVAGVTLYAYQTDSSGLYQNDSSHIARLHGWIRTDAQGRFEFRTIRPAPYPNRSIPAHIHFHAWGGGYPLQWTEDLKFADDPLLTPHDTANSQALGDFGNIRPVTHSPDRVWHCTIRFRLSRQTNYPAQYRDDPRTR